MTGPDEQRFRARLAALDAAAHMVTGGGRNLVNNDAMITDVAENFERWLLRPAVETLNTSKTHDGATDRPSCSTIWRKADGAGHMCALDEHGDRRHACSCGETLD